MNFRIFFLTHLVSFIDFFLVNSNIANNLNRMLNWQITFLKGIQN